MSGLDSLIELMGSQEDFEVLPVDARLSVKGDVPNLLPLFQRAAAVVAKKDTGMGLTHALLEAVPTSSNEAAYLRITASDGDQTVSVVADNVNVLMGGSVLLPPKRVEDILKLAPTQAVKIEVLGTAATIRSGRAQWTVQSPVGETLNALLKVDGLQMHTLSVGPFVNAVSVARRAASAKSAWFGLNQLQIRTGTVTGCDGGRLHRSLLKDLDPSLDLTIPIKTVDELLRALAGSQSRFFEMGYDDHHLLFNIDQDFIVAQRLLVAFPDIENLLLGPTFANMNSLTIERRDLQETVKRVRVNSDPDTDAISLMLLPGKKDDEGLISWQLGVRAKDRSGNGSQEIIDCQWVGPSGSRTITVNHRYLLDFLDCYDTETVVFKVGDGGKTNPSPLLINDETLGFSGIVQQMHAAW